MCGGTDDEGLILVCDVCDDAKPDTARASKLYDFTMCKRTHHADCSFEEMCARAHVPLHEALGEPVPATWKFTCPSCGEVFDSTAGGHQKLDDKDEELEKIAAGAKGSRKKTIHGAFTYQMCAGAKWCSYAAIPDEWFGPYRAKCAWSGARFDDLAPRWRNPTGHGKVFHPVKLRAPTSGRDFRHFRCKELFAKEARANVAR